jgi:HTH-type transcriptional regulator, competence development regulator
MRSAEVLDDRRRMDQVAERLAELRERRALTLRELGEMSGVAADTINQIGLGHRKARPSTLRKLARALEIDVQEFYAEPALPKAEAPREAGPSLLEKALNAARQDEEKTARAINRLAASEGVLPGTYVVEHEEDSFRAELRTLGFPDEYFESFIWPLVVEAARVESLEQALAVCEEERRREMAQNR